MKTMQKYILILSIMISGFLNAAISEIREIDGFSEIDFDAFKPGDVVVFDVDDVLIEPGDKVGLHTSQHKVIKTFDDYVSSDDSEECISIMLRDMKKVVIEHEIIEKIKRLKARGVTVIALTSCRIGKFGVIESYEKMCHSSLNEFGFTWSFEDEICIFNHLKKEGKEYAPLFFKGIIIVGAYSKGEVLDAFLTWKQLTPSMIFFIDNHLKHLLSVKEVCDGRLIPFIGCHYFGGSKVELDEEKMHKQFQHLSKHKAWLSDKACQALGEPEFKRRKMNDNSSD